ncbi:YceD family protein [Muricoccus vinaceus]|uniref:DUF177 domain-containing protein n=1 Tax=Muricoccus vinaceus TaxID=424704 RepID=A0ABV6IY64_9PROT
MTAEFHRSLRHVSVSPQGRQERLEATPEEREALARRLGLLSLEAFSAEIHLTPAPGQAIRARGTLSAQVVQECVVTLEPVHQPVKAAIDWRILPPGEEPSDDLEEGPDEIESNPDGTTDIGEALVQELALSLDPYPRAPGAELPAEAKEGGSSPFAALRALGAIQKPG